MKTPCIHLDQSIVDGTKLMINEAKSFTWNGLFAISGITSDKVNYYLTLLMKQIFNDSFSGSDAETAMVLIFLKSYLLAAMILLSNNVVIDFFKDLGKTSTKLIMLDTEENFNIKKAA